MVAIACATSKSLFDAASIIVVKVGSALLVDEANNTINRTWLDGIAADIASLHATFVDFSPVIVAMPKVS